MVLLAFMMIIFVAMAAFSVNVAYMQLVRTELRAATDSAARAGAEALSRTQDWQVAREQALLTASQNTVAGAPLALRESDIVFGKAAQQGGSGAWVFTPGAQPYNSVRVHGTRENGSLAGSVPLFFGGVLTPDNFEPLQIATASQLDRDICVVIDRSGSMAWDLSDADWSYPPGVGSYPDAYCLPPHPTLSRFGAAAAAFEIFLQKLDETDQVEHVCLATYASSGNWCNKSYAIANLESQLAGDYNVARTAMANRMSKPIPGGTAIGEGLRKGTAELTSSRARPLARKTIVLLTDGVHNNGVSPLTAASEASALGITIHTITFSAGADQSQMAQVAQIGGGHHYHAPDAATLNEAFRDIALTLPVVLTD